MHKPTQAIHEEEEYRFAFSLKAPPSISEREYSLRTLPRKRFQRARIRRCFCGSGPLEDCSRVLRYESGSSRKRLRFTTLAQFGRSAPDGASRFLGKVGGAPGFEPRGGGWLADLGGLLTSWRRRPFERRRPGPEGPALQTDVQSTRLNRSAARGSILRACGATADTSLGAQP